LYFSNLDIENVLTFIIQFSLSSMFFYCYAVSKAVLQVCVFIWFCKILLNLFLYNFSCIFLFKDITQYYRPKDCVTKGSKKFWISFQKSSTAKRHKIQSNWIVSFIIRFFPVSHWLFFKYLQSFILCFSYILLFSKLSSTNNSIY